LKKIERELQEAEAVEGKEKSRKMVSCNLIYSNRKVLYTFMLISFEFITNSSLG
jgi:hypothetical protein